MITSSMITSSMITASMITGYDYSIYVRFESIIKWMRKY